MTPKPHNSNAYPFGSVLGGRNGNSSIYKYGYQGSEKDDEVKGAGNSYTTEYRFLDPRLGRWLSIDAVTNPRQSPYCSMGNNPIWYNDPLGLYETRREARQARRAAKEAGYDPGRIYQSGGEFGFTILDNPNGKAEGEILHIFSWKASDFSKGSPYSTGDHRDTRAFRETYSKIYNPKYDIIYLLPIAPIYGSFKESEDYMKKVNWNPFRSNEKGSETGNDDGLGGGNVNPETNPDADDATGEGGGGPASNGLKRSSKNSSKTINSVQDNDYVNQKANDSVWWTLEGKPNKYYRSLPEDHGSVKKSKEYKYEKWYNDPNR